MDRNTFTGLFLILIILVGSTFLLKPSEEEIKRKASQDSIAVSQQNTANKQIQKTTPAASQNIPVASQQDSTKSIKESFTTLENEFLKISISNKGGKIASVTVKDQTTFQGKPLVLFDANDTGFGLMFNANGKNVNTGTLFFNTISSANNKLVLRYNYDNERFIDYIYSLEKSSYKVGFDIQLVNLQGVIANNTSNIVLNWQTKLLQQEKDIKNERLYSTTYYKLLNGDVENLDEGKSEEKSIEDSKINWVSFKQHFFSAALINKQGFNKGTVGVTTLDDDSGVKAYNAKLNLPYTPKEVSNYPMEFYFGPNKYSLLKDQGYDLEKQIKQGWGPLKWINRYAVLPLFNFLDSFNLSFGIIILVLTLILKLVLFPFTYKSYLSMAKMRVLKPEMDEIKKKVGDDNQTLLQQEYLKLYKQAGVNPLGGCLPLLFQMPFIIAFFYFFPNLFELRGESFLWMKDLSTYDELITFAPIPLLGWNHISLMCLLMTISTLIYTYFNNQVSGVQGQMKYIGYITPLIFFGVLNSYPAGLNYYYFCANILTFSQQYLIRQFVNDDKIHAKIQENKKKPESAKKKGGFQKKLEDIMRQQQQQKNIK